MRKTQYARSRPQRHWPSLRDDLIPCNAATGERPRSRRQREEVKALSPALAHALLDTARGARNEVLYMVAVHTGLRQGELLGLKWTDVDLTGRRLSVRRALKVTDHGLDFGPPKNKASRRSVPLSKTAVAGPASSQDPPERREATTRKPLARSRPRFPQPRR